MKYGFRVSRQGNLRPFVVHHPRRIRPALGSANAPDPDWEDRYAQVHDLSDFARIFENTGLTESTTI